MDLSLVLQEPSTAAVGSSVGFFLWHADAHVDPFYQSEHRQCKENLTLLEQNPFGIMSCDPPPKLLHSALAESRLRAAEAGHAAFALYTGDFVRHSIREMPEPAENASQIVKQVSLSAKSFFPETPLVFGTLENSDAKQDYYQEVTSNQSSNPWFEKLGGLIHGAGGMKQTVLEQFKHGSYFETTEGNVTILSLATVIYSVDHLPFGPLEEDPFGQFQWLRKRLRLAALEQRRVLIVGHISPGIETFGYTELWCPEYVAQYLEIVQDPVLGSIVSAQLFGHVHKDEIRILPKAPRGAGPIFLSSSLSPVYYNNPSFKLVEYDRRTGRLLNLKTFISDTFSSSQPSGAPTWRFGYDHVSEYGFSFAGLTMAEMVNFTASLLDGGENYRKYASWYATGYPNELEHYSLEGNTTWNSTWKQQRRREYVCAMVIQTAAEFARCAGLSTWQLPSLMEDIDRLILGRLLAWAMRSQTPTAKKILQMANRGEWEELLSLFRGLARWSLQQGKPLESILLTF